MHGYYSYDAKKGNAGLTKIGKYLKDILGPSIQFCITGGSQITNETLKIVNAIGYPLVNGYGSTEIGISSFANPKKLKTRVIDSIGVPFKYFEYSLSAENELLVKGSSTYHAILKNGEWEIRDKSSFIKTADSAHKIKNNYFRN